MLVIQYRLNNNVFINVGSGLETLDRTHLNYLNYANRFDEVKSFRVSESAKRHSVDSLKT
jgi:hypothetical protein